MKIRDYEQDEIIQFHNDYCDREGSEDQIYENNGDFFDLFFSKPIDAVRAAQYGDYRYTDNFVRFDGYGNLESTDEPLEWVDFDALEQTSGTVTLNPKEL